MISAAATALTACSQERASQQTGAARSDAAAPRAEATVEGWSDGPGPYTNAAAHGGVEWFGGPGSDRQVAFSGRAAASLEQHSFPTDGRDFDPALDATGRRMVFASTRHSIFSHLYIKGVDGATLTQVTDARGNDAQPVFSPDGRRIAFASDRAGNWDVWVVDADGRNPTQITNNPMPELRPSWSPDGRRLVFCRVNPPHGFGELWIVDVASPSMRKLVGEGLYPAWSPRGDRIAYQRAKDRGSRLYSIWTIDLVNDEPRFPTEIAGSAECGLVTPAWSPDGDRLTFSLVAPASDAGVRGTARIGASSERSAIGIVDVDGRGMQVLTDELAECHAPFWSSSEKIYFASRVEGREAIWSVVPLRRSSEQATAAAVNTTTIESMTAEPVAGKVIPVKR